MPELNDSTLISQRLLNPADEIIARRDGATPSIVRIPLKTFVPEQDIPPANPHAMDDEFTGTSLNPKWTVANLGTAAINYVVAVENGRLTAHPGLAGEGQYTKPTTITQPIPTEVRTSEYVYSLGISLKSDLISNREHSAGMVLKYANGNHRVFALNRLNNGADRIQIYLAGSDAGYIGEYVEVIINPHHTKMYFRIVRSSFHGRTFLQNSIDGLGWKTTYYYNSPDQPVATDVGYFFSGTIGDSNETRQFHQINWRSDWFRCNQGLVV